MGMDPHAKIWVGVNGDVASEIRERGLIADDFSFDDTYPQAHFICDPDYLETDDELDGYGMTLLSQDWNENGTPIDLALLFTQEKIAEIKMRELLTRHSIDAEIKTYVQTDYT